jgi:hypothetical protein
VFLYNHPNSRHVNLIVWVHDYTYLLLTASISFHCKMNSLQYSVSKQRQNNSITLEGIHYLRNNIITELLWNC